jgi:ubiquinone/menaquinone biosynthesis C-methylase UbiE
MMERRTESVEQHYGVSGILESIFEALRSMGKDIEQLVPSDLAPVDAFHIRGREATAELAQLAALTPGLRILDVGSGLGGSTRYLASEYDCRPTGLDLTREYCDIAEALSQKVGLDSVVDYQHGSALEMPFEDATFDIVWTEHAQMNIADKSSLYQEISRVLTPGGRLVFHDIFQGPSGDSHYPVPWAEDPSISFLMTPDMVRQTLEQIGFRILVWEDKTTTSLEWFYATVERMKTAGPVPLGLHLLMGANSRIKLENQIRNLEEERIVVFQAVLELSS